MKVSFEVTVKKSVEVSHAYEFDLCNDEDRGTLAAMIRCATSDGIEFFDKVAEDAADEGCDECDDIQFTLDVEDSDPMPKLITETQNRYRTDFELIDALVRLHEEMLAPKRGE